MQPFAHYQSFHPHAHPSFPAPVRAPQERFSFTKLRACLAATIQGCPKNARLEQKTCLTKQSSSAFSTRPRYTNQKTAQAPASPKHIEPNNPIPRQFFAQTSQGGDFPSLRCLLRTKVSSHPVSPYESKRETDPTTPEQAQMYDFLRNSTHSSSISSSTESEEAALAPTPSVFLESFDSRTPPALPISTGHPCTPEEQEEEDEILTFLAHLPTPFPIHSPLFLAQRAQNHREHFQRLQQKSEEIAKQQNSGW